MQLCEGMALQQQQHPALQQHELSSVVTDVLPLTAYASELNSPLRWLQDILAVGNNAMSGSCIAVSACCWVCLQDSRCLQLCIGQ